MKKIYIFLFSMLALMSSFAQTTLISPTGDGGFENGTTFLANGWQLSNSANNPWVLGGVNVTAPFVGRSAYPSLDNGVSSSYNLSNPCQNYFWRDVTVPAGEARINLSFNWIGQGEATWDIVQVFAAPTTVTPVSSATHPGSGTSNVPAAIAGATFIANTAPGTSGVQTITATLPSSLAGTTFRLIFLWKSDVSAGTQPPVSVDNISLLSAVPTSITSTAIGGLWSSPATWIGGIVPAGDDVIISDGAVVTVNQAVSVRDLILGGGTSGILQWNDIANTLVAFGNVVINSGANLNMFTAAASPNGVSFSVGGNFTNNGTVHAAYVNANHALLNFNGNTNPTLSGTGNFVGNIISGLFFQNTSNSTINTSSNLITRTFAHTAGTVNTNGKLTIDNTAQVFGLSLNQRVYEIVVTNMGSGYNTATPPTITLGAPTGTGVQASATPNIDDATGTLRSITITNAGDGYRANPTVTISGGTGTGATAIAVIPVVSNGVTTGSTQRSGGTTITGGINIKSDQAVGNVYTTNGGVGYATAPQVGFALPNSYLNLVTAGGSGYSTAPTVTASGGTQIGTTTTMPTFTTVVAQGKVVSVIPTTTGNTTLWLVPPTITITGGGGSGATAAYPPTCLATATSSISNGLVSNVTITNGGFGYTAAPTVGFVGGGSTTAAATPVSRVGLYNLTLAFFAPSTSNAIHTEDGIIPANRRINSLILSNASLGFNVTGNLELYASSPFTFTSGIVNMGGNTLFTSHPAYAGTTGSATNNVTNGSIRLSTPGGSLTRTFPFNPSFVAVTGTGSLATGSTVTSLTVTRTGAPSGTVSPSGNTTGTRAYRVVANSGAIYGINPTITMNYDAVDALVADNPTLFIGQATALTGPWTNRSISSGTGSLTATGSRTTATTTPGPIVPTGDDYYAWTTTFVPPTCAIPTAVATNTVTTSSANVTFTGSGSAYILEYGLSGFTPGLGATPGTGGTIITSASSPIAITGLASGTSYDVYVRQDCTGASNGYSPNSNVVSFVTLVDCASLPVLSCSTPATTGVLSAAGGLYSFGTCGFTTPGKERIYSFTSTTAGTYTLNITSLNGGSGYLDYFFKVADGNCGVSTGYNCIGDKSAVSTTTFTLAASTTYYIMVDAESSTGTTNQTFQIDCPSACPAPTSVGTNTITSTTANVTFTGAGTSYIVEYGPTGFTVGTGATAGSGSSLIATGTGSPIALSGLTPGTAYQVYVRQDCTGAGNGFSFNSTVITFTTLAPPPANDLPAGAVTLLVDGGCTGNPYDNTSATQSVNEPYTSCKGTTGYASVWYKFVAPTSGSVKVSCDGTGTLGDSRMALFSTTDVNDFTRFSIITCDDDNGVVGGTRSLFYTSGLTAGDTYYVVVDLYAVGSTKGTFCVTVDELNATMLTTTAADCVSDQASVGGFNATYRGWVSLVDAAGNLNANVRQNTGTATGFSSSRTIKTGAARTVNGVPYMNRNFLVSGSGATSADVQFYFTDAELSNLGSSLATLQASRVPGNTCNANFAGLDSVLTQGLNGSGNGVNFVQVPTPGFSNFYIRGAGGVLPVSIEFFRGSKLAAANYLDWKVSCTSQPSVQLSLERSADGINFTEIDFQTASATRCLQGFNYTDNKPLAGFNYYRLKTISPDGKIGYSTIVVLLNKEKGFELISLAPNPVKNTSILSLTTVKGGKIDISVSDVTGKVISKQSTVVIAGNNPIVMNFSSLSAGTYFITAVNAEGELKTTRFVKY